MATVSGASAQTEGTHKWSVVLGTNGVTRSSPTIGPDGTVYIGVETTGGGIIQAVNPGNLARPKWSRVVREAVQSSPAIGPDGTIYIGCDDGKLYALNPADGTSRGDCDLHTSISSSPAIAADGTIYVGGLDFSLHAIAPGGTERWKFATGDVITSSPAIGADGAIYFGSYDHFVYAVTPDNVQKWRYQTGGVVHSSPAIGKDGSIYVGSEDQAVYAFNSDGSLKWTKATNGIIQSSPSIGADGTIYIASNDLNFYALSPEDGSERWKFYLGTTTTSTAAVRGDGVIIVGGDDGIVHALKPDGTVAWNFNTSSTNGTEEDREIESSPMVGLDGTVYVGCLDGRLYAIWGNGSPLSKTSPWPAFRRDIFHTGRAAPDLVGGRLANIASRGRVTASDQLIAGFVVGGGSRTYLLRAIGPGLRSISGLTTFLPNPRLDLYALSGSGPVLLQTNDNWPTRDAVSGFSLADTAVAVGAFELVPGSADAAIVRAALSPGNFTANVVSVDGNPGVGLVELYDTPGETAGRLLNLSTRARVGTGDDVLIAGFVIGGVGPMRLLLRGIGPGLTQFGVPGVLARPRIELFRGQTPIAANTGWTSDGFKYDLKVAAASVSAFPLADGSLDSAMTFDAEPGLYTIQLSGVNQTTGVGLVEIWVLP